MSAAVHEPNRMEAEVVQSARFKQVMAFYNKMIDVTEDSPSSPRWERDVHPAPQEVLASIEAGQIFVVFDDSLEGGIAAAMRVAREELPLPSQVQWRVNAPVGQSFTLCLLAVHPDAQGRGLAKQMVARAIREAREGEARALRLDCLAANYQAAGLYEKLGFAHCGTGAFHPKTLDDAQFFAFELAL